jgi:hypothetical protein
MPKHLPTEILLNIFSIIDNDYHTLKSLRLCSRRFGGIASEALFMSANLSSHGNDLQVFKAIAEHPKLHRFVRKIVYFEPVIRFTTINEVEARARIIADALSRMPHVREVVFKNHWFPPSDGITGGVNRGEFDYDYGFDIMCRAFSMGKICLQSLSVDYRPPTGFHADTFLSMSPGVLEHACNSFRHLRAISLAIAQRGALEFTSTPRDTRNLEYSLARILAAAKDLEQLTVIFNESYLYRPLSEVLGNHTWPRLQSLCICKKLTGEEELTDLIYRHHRTLKSLRLDRVLFRGPGSWWKWAENIRSWASSSLKQIEFEGLMYEGKRALGSVPGCCLKNYISVGQLNCNSCNYASVRSEARAAGSLSNEDMIRMFGAE